MENNTKVTENTQEPSALIVFWAYLNYVLNKLMPTLLVSFICFYSIGFATW